MDQFWRNSSVTAVGLFLERCALYLVFAATGVLFQQPGIVLPFWLVLLSLGWSFVFMSYILSANVNSRVRGLLGIVIGVPSLLLLVNMNTGAGYLPVGTFISGEGESIVAIVGSAVFLIAVWWRGASAAKEQITLDALRSAFMWGLGVLFATGLLDSMVQERVANGFLVVSFFVVGLLGLSLVRFSSDAGETHAMSREWVMPIVISVFAVLLFGLIISGIGLGGLDDVTRRALRVAGAAGFWLLRPVLLLMGLVAGGIVSFGNWLSAQFGGGDFTGLMNAQSQLEEFHRGLREQADDKEPATALVTTLKLVALGIGSLIAGWLVYRLFRSRRFMPREVDVEETRESLFSWQRANDDLSDLLAAWWTKMFPLKEKASGDGDEPNTPKEYYHGFLGLTNRLGRPRRNWETPNEHQRGIWSLLPTEPVYRIVQRFQRSHYGRNEQDEAGLESLRNDWAEINEFVDQEEL